MNPADVEQLIGARIRLAAEQAMAEAIREVNASGRQFAPVGDIGVQWREPQSNDVLSIWCTISVHLAPAADNRPDADPTYRAFEARALSGTDAAAALLSRLESDVANGGFYQTLEYHGETFLDECAVELRAIRATATLRMVEQALRVWRDAARTRSEYQVLREQLLKIDRRFGKRTERLAALFAQAHKENH